MPVLSVIEGSDVPVDLVETLRPIVTRHSSLEQVVRFGLSHPEPKLIADVVVQDEYTHDVVLPYDDHLVLVYDTT